MKHTKHTKKNTKIETGLKKFLSGFYPPDPSNPRSKKRGRKQQHD